MTAWAIEEFAGAKLGDGRLNARLIKLAARLADKQTAIIPGACPIHALLVMACLKFVPGDMKELSGLSSARLCDRCGKELRGK